MKIFKKLVITIVVIISIVAVSKISVQATEKSTLYKLVWSDEFTGTELNMDNWQYNIGAGGWGNNEHQYYTDREENIKIENGKLIITARAEEYENNGQKANYTSARITTSGLQSFKYGKIEARMKLPDDMGLWPAFWMLGQNEPKGWPYCGEIDILEAWNDLRFAQGALHWEDEISRPNKDTYVAGKISGIDKTKWHIYGIVWSPKSIQWTFDNKVFWEYKINTSAQSELHKEFYILLNCAVGGNLPYYTPNEDFVSAQVEVDYVRVYQRESDNGTFTGTWAQQDIDAVKQHTVKFKNQGKIISTQLVRDRETVVLPKVSRKGYEFLGWYNGKKKVTENTRIKGSFTVKSKWKRIKIAQAKITSTKQQYKRAATLRFKVKGKVDGYQVKVGNKKDITTSKIITFGPFKSKKTYKAKVRAYVIDSRGKKIYGKWSKTVKITIK